MRCRPESSTGEHVRAYTSGQCHALSLALHEATGWPIVGAEDEELDICHFFVRTPDGRLVDITGAHDPRRAIQLEHMTFCPGVEYLTEQAPERVAALGDEPGWRKPDLETARSFVAPLLRACGLEAPGDAAPPGLYRHDMASQAGKALVEEMMDEWIAVTLADGKDPEVAYGEGVKQDSELHPAAEMALRIIKAGKPTPDLCDWDPDAHGTAMLTLERTRKLVRIEVTSSPQVDLDRGTYSEAQALAISAAHALRRYLSSTGVRIETRIPAPSRG